mmetsp:Transcript_3441/g.8973  ORF Transcript_3441/g.8973 Transcript_3441/m.8973 type:complete len:330 (-) Transcript_3441:587-1576(-)
MTVCSFMAFSLFRSSVISFFALYSSAISSARASMSCCSVTISELVKSMDAWCVSMSAARSSRLVTAADISVSQKLFCVASAVASASSFAMRSLMSPRTSTKWSTGVSASLAASAASTGLCSADARCSRSLAAGLTDFGVCASCSRDGAAWRRTAAARRPLAGDSALCASPTSFLLTLYRSPMPSSTPTASVSFVISLARVFERVSHAVALASQEAVSSSRKAWSAPCAVTSSALRPSFSAFSVLFCELSCCFWSISACRALTLFNRAPSIMLCSCASAASSSPTRASSCLNVLRRFRRVSRTSLEPYSYLFGFPAGVSRPALLSQAASA